MTTEEKAKAYDKALEVAGRLLNSPRTCFDINQLTEIFPKLEEDRNEKIRESMIQYFTELKKYGYSSTRISKDDCIAYLEKQKDQPTNEEMLRTLRAEYEKGVADTIAKYERRKDHESAGWSEGDYHWEGLVELLRDYQKTIDRNSNNMVYEDVECYISWLKSLPLDLKKKNENVAKLCSNEWSEEDEECLKELIQYIEQRLDDGTTGQSLWKKWHNWLKSLHEKFNLQPKPEWSDKDEWMLKEIISFFKDGTVKLQHDLDLYASFLETKFKSICPQPYKETYQAVKPDLASGFMNYLDANRPEEKMCLSNIECKDIDKAFKENDWAKIMRYAEKYLSHWKPSDEQMDAINKAVCNFRMEDTASCEKTADVLESLYYDLKKL